MSDMQTPERTGVPSAVLPVGPRMRAVEPRLIILDPSYKNSVGHYSEYDEALAKAALDSGFGVEIAGHVRARETRGDHRHVLGAFSQDIWCRLPGAQFMSDESLIWSSELILAETIASIDHVASHPDDILFAPNVTPPQLLAFSRLLDDAPLDGVLLLLIRYQVEMFNHPMMSNAWATVRRHIGRGRARVLTDSHLLARDLHGIGLSDVDVVSVPSGGQFADGPRRSCPGGPFTVTSLGPPRAEKGFLEILKAAEILALEDPTIHFDLQANDPSEDVKASLQAFRRSAGANVRLVDTAMTAEEYSNFVLAADVVVAPYDPSIYAARTSSAIVEAIAAEKPVIVTRGTWLEAFAATYRTGLTCSFGDAEDLVRTIMRARREIASLNALAGLAAPAVRRHYTASRLMEQLVASRDMARGSNRPTVLILFPWAAEDIRASGSGARLRALVAEVERWGLRAEILCFGHTSYALGDHSMVYSFTTLFWDVLDSSVGVPGLDRVTEDRALHLRLHRQSADDAGLLDEIRRAARGCVGVIVEHTHLALAARTALAETGMAIVVVSNDFIREPGLKDNEDPVVLAQIEALRAGTAAFAVSADDAKAFARLGITCRLSKNPAQPKMNPRPSTDLVAEVLGAYLPGVESGSFLLFVGSAYYPNRAAVTVLHEMAALLRRQLGSKAPTVVIAGSVSEPMRMDNVVALGVLPRVVLEVLYDACLTTVIPLFAGSGTSVKTIEAIDRGCPVLTTTSGARGLKDLAGRFQALKCSEREAAAAFANEIVRTGATLASSRRPPQDDFVDDYAVDGFAQVVKAVARDFATARKIPDVDLELVDELLAYAREGMSQAALEQALAIAGSAAIPLPTRLTALSAACALRRLPVTPILLGRVAEERTLVGLTEAVAASARESVADLSPDLLAKIDALGLASLAGGTA